MGNSKFKDSIPLFLALASVWMIVNMICAFSISSMVDRNVLDSNEIFDLFIRISIIELVSFVILGIIITFTASIVKKIKKKNNENKHSKHN